MSRIKKKLNLLGVSWEEKKHSYSKMKDADLVINEVLGKMRVENANVL